MSRIGVSVPFRASLVLVVAVVFARAIGGFLEEKRRREDEHALDELRRGAKPS